jgi:hypothetical protein
MPETGVSAQMKSINISTIKSLFARSLDRCAFPGCSSPMAETNNVVTGEVCHIKASSPGGPRYDPHQTDEDRHSEGNLILLCGRHHTLVDADPKQYTVDALLQMKRDHQGSGTPSIPIGIDRIAKQLLKNYESQIAIHANSGVVAINSPNSTIIQTVNIKQTRAKQNISIEPPIGSIASSQPMVLYIGHLIDRYQEFQKAHTDKAGNRKFMMIHIALKREFKGDWKLLPADRFVELASYLQGRIDKTLLGRINKSKGIKNYSTFEEHQLFRR